MPALSVLDGAALARVARTYRDVLRSHREELNRLNVYPVPDGDTGTNMVLTLESVCDELGDAKEMPVVCQAVAHGSLMGARGNSGVILSQILRGLTETFSDLVAAGPSDVALALGRAADAAYQAVMHPVEGTILTVARRAGDEAATLLAKDPGVALVTLLELVATAAREAVTRTREQLPVLAEAGVVDAGGLGLALLLDACLHVVDGRALPRPEVVPVPEAVERYRGGAGSRHPQPATDGGRYEVMFFLEASNDAIAGFREAWDAIGDSVVVVGGDGLWNCHVHTDDIGAAIEAGLGAGRPRDVRVTDLLDQVRQHTTEADGGVRAEGHAGPFGCGPEVQTAVVAVAAGEGVARLMHSLGVAEIVVGGQSMNPSTAQILAAVERTHAESVVVLPNNANVVAVAEQVPALTEHKVGIVPTHSILEGLAALVSYDPSASLPDNLSSMYEAAERVRTGEVTRAVRAGHGMCGPIAEGDWLVITEEGIVATAGSPLDAAIDLVDRLVEPGDELVTVLVGEGASPDDTKRLCRHLSEGHPHVEVEVHEGGQPLYPYLIGVE